MQARETGFLDKHGKMIKEGDTIAVDFGDNVGVLYEQAKVIDYEGTWMFEQRATRMPLDGFLQHELEIKETNG